MLTSVFRLVRNLDGIVTIRECVYNEEGELELLGVSPIAPEGRDAQELLDDMNMIARAVEDPIIDEGDLDIEDVEEGLVAFYSSEPEGVH